MKSRVMLSVLERVKDAMAGGAFCAVLVFAAPGRRSTSEVFVTPSAQSFCSAADECAQQSATGKELIGFIALQDVQEWGKHAIRLTEQCLPCTDDEDEPEVRRALLRRVMQGLHSSTFCRWTCPDIPCRIAAACRAEAEKEGDSNEI